MGVLDGDESGADSTATVATGPRTTGPTRHETPLQAAATITRDNLSWTTGLGRPVTVTYGFRAAGPAYTESGENLQGTFVPFNTAQIDAVTQIMGLWSDVANIAFRRIGTGDTGAAAYSDNASILFGDYDSATDASGAFTYYPAPGGLAGARAEGDVWDNAHYATNLSPVQGNYGWLTLVHEVGHALGLEHPGDYNAAPGVSITYAANATYVEDSREYTVMSYFDAFNTGADHTSSTGLQYAATPLLDDVAALQRLYGANTTTRTGNTTYGFNSNADRAVFHLDSARDQRVMTLYDAGGYNTIDMSGYATNQVIDLIAGTLSSTGSLTNNLAIALGTVIQGAIGGAGNDTFLVNAADDTIDGRGGINAVVLPGNRADYAVTRGSTVVVKDANTLRGGTDQLTNIRYLQFADQTLDLSVPVASPPAAPADPLFDAAYYLAHNADVRAAGIDPYQHYMQIGWHEGRNPSALFDTSYYLARNADVAAAGYNPLQHFETNGAFEGRDPSLLFSTSAYLAANADVRTAGYDALQHYVTNGQAEGRAAFLVGPARPADPLVDAAFYDRQLGATLVPAGVAGQQQAAASYDSTGWQKGLNPDAWFDTTYYLSHNPDVAAAHIDPLLHYETSGWHEGRDPSAQFSTAKYLAANRDVAAAGYDPLLHYVTNGLAEGRAIYAA